MACGLSKSFGLSSSLKKQQGIVTILGGGDCDSSSILTVSSLRRTFSADLYSKKLFLDNGFSPMKRVSSSEKLCAFGTDSLNSGDEEDDEEGLRSGFDIWAQIQEDKNKEVEIELGQSDIWSSILSEKKKIESSNDTVPPPYVHPLVKRASSLSEKSLEICTESLGSETGCEGFASYSSYETGDSKIEKEVTNKEEKILSVKVANTKVEEETEAEVEVKQESITVSTHTICMENPGGSFPPPIRSLSSQLGSSLEMKTCRNNGRLVLEAVSTPSHNNFSTKRQNGRLLLTFTDISNESIDINKEDETDSEVQWSDEENKEEEEEETQDEFAYKPNGLITLHRLAHKPIKISKRNSKWPITDEFSTKSELTPVVHSLPPITWVAQLTRSTKPPSTVDDTIEATCFNTCDYFWKPKALGPIKAHVIVAGHDSWINRCKERRKSLLSVETFCIATS